MKVLSSLRSSNPSRRGRIERRERVCLDPGRRDRFAGLVANRLNQDADNMMHAFPIEQARKK
jgi:hypothetical protein